MKQPGLGGGGISQIAYAIAAELDPNPVNIHPHLHCRSDNLVLAYASNIRSSHASCRRCLGSTPHEPLATFAPILGRSGTVEGGDQGGGVPHDTESHTFGGRSSLPLLCPTYTPTVPNHRSCPTLTTNHQLPRTPHIFTI